LLSEAVDRFAAKAAMSDVKRGELQVALEEVATNVIKYGYGQCGVHSFAVTLTLDGEEVIAEAEDDAPAYDPLARADSDITLPLDERPIGGLGVRMVKHLMDAVH